VKIDPQTRANAIMAALLKKHNGKRSKNYWERVVDMAAVLERDSTGPREIVGEGGAKLLTKRFRSDMMKVAAILEETARQHIEVLKVIENPSVVEQISDEIGKIFDKEA